MKYAIINDNNISLWSDEMGLGMTIVIYVLSRIKILYYVLYYTRENIDSHCSILYISK
jgi:hypothetical protein